MKSCIFFLAFLLLINQVHLYLRGDQREQLMAKLATKITEDNINLFYEEENELYGDGQLKQMSYDLDEILHLMNQYNLPKSYNIFDDGITKDVKNQGGCGCCWSFSATSALGYRYNKLGEKISLSPQDGLSCYLRLCNGANLLDPQLNLVRNGSLTEQCFPYKSSDGKTIPKCPTTCEDGSEFKKYYAQNAYRVLSTQQNFNELVILVMDQLITQGPVSTGFRVYSDFRTFSNDKQKCLNEVYTYDGVSPTEGNHAVTIVGYGVLNNKIYWLIQNSWGSKWCDNGLIKMEIGQFIEVSFCQPLKTSGSKTPVEIEVKLYSQDQDCKLNIEKPSSINNWNNTVFIDFEHEAKTHTFEFQVGKNKLLGNDEINCYYEVQRVSNYMRKGTYIFKGAETFGKDNKFNLDSFKNTQFTFYGADDLYQIYETLYVSKVGSKIVFFHDYKANDDSLPPIYLYDQSDPLSKCRHLKTSTEIPYKLGYCEMTQDEISYLQQYRKVLVEYGYLCKLRNPAQFYLGLLGNYNPVFNIINFYKPKNIDKLDYRTRLLLSVKISGSTHDYNNDGQFITILEVENNNKNTSIISNCNATVYENKEYTNFTCSLDINRLVLPFQNIYLLPYSLINKATLVFEVFIEKEMKASNETIPPAPGPDPKPAVSSYLVYSQTLFAVLLLILF